VKRLHSIALVFALWLFPTLAHADPLRGKGALIGPVTITGSSTTTTRHWFPSKDATALVVFVDSSRGGHLTIYRVDTLGRGHAQSSPTTVAAGSEDIEIFSYPMHELYVQFASTSTLSQTVQIEVDDGRSR